MINIKDFSKLDVRVGTIIKAEILEGAHKPSYHLEIDFGSLGIKHSSAQITVVYTINDLIGRQIIGVRNLPSKNIAGVKSEVLVLGANNEEDAVVLLEPDKKIPNGSKIS